MDWLAAPPGINLTRVFAVIYTAAFFVQQLRFFPDQRRFIQIEPPTAQVMQILGIRIAKVGPRAAIRAARLLIVALGATLAANLLGLDLPCRLLYGASFVLLAVVYPHISSLGYVIRKILFAPVVFVVLAFAPGLTDGFESSQTLWPFALLQGYLALLYASTGIEKVIASGRMWLRGDVLRGYLVSHHLWGDMPRGLAVANRRWLCRAMSVPTLAWEVVFPLALFAHPLVTVAFVVYGVMFHIGTAVLMRIDYHEYWFMNYLVFLPQFYVLAS